MCPVGPSSIFIILCLNVMTVRVSPSSPAHSIWLLLMMSGGPMRYEESSFDRELLPAG
jgi:hypothetical protein